MDIRRFPWIRKLAADYAYNYPAVAPFFVGDPSAGASWVDAIRRAQGYPRRSSEILGIVAAQQRRRGAPPEAVAAAKRLADSGAVAIVTGQQAGLFGGPLFTLLKALTAVKLAEEVAHEHRLPTVAVFWIDAEDHDWHEVSSCGVLDVELRPRTIALPDPRGAGEVPVSSVALDASVSQAIDELGSALQPTEFTDALLAGLRASYRPGVGMAEAFGRLMEATLGRLGLIVFDSSDPAAKPFVGKLFAQELRAPGRTASLAAGAGEELVARGYHAQVTPHLDSAALFHLDGGRRPIRQQGDRFVVGDRTFRAASLTERVEATPAEFSPNVLLRPIVQDTLFPTICYVAGPNELGYQAQLRGVYEHFGVPMPLLYPRASATLIDSAAARFLTRYDLPLESLQPQDEAALNRLLEAQLPPIVEQTLEDASRGVEERMAALIAAVPAIDPTLEGAARSTLGKMQHELRTLHAKIIHGVKRRDETLRRQFMRTRAQAFPGGEPQERAVGFVYFLNRYGPALVERLLEALPLDLGRHWIVTI